MARAPVSKAVSFITLREWFADPVQWGIVCLLTAMIFLFQDSFSWLAEEWSSGSGFSSHGFLVCAICIWLLLRDSRAVSLSELKPLFPVFLVLLGLSFIWLLGAVANVVAVQTTVLPLIMLSAVLLAFGYPSAKKLSFSILFLFFSLPVWTHISFVFQAITTIAVSIAIRLTDIPVFVEGNYVSVPAGTFEIAEGCSGINFLAVGLSLAALYGHLYIDSVRSRVVLAVVALSMAMIFNWIRVFTVILIGNASDMQNPLVADHGDLGWVIFGIFLLPLFWIGRRLESGVRPKPEPSLPRTIKGPHHRILFGVALAVFAMSVGPVWAFLVKPSPDEFIEANLTLPLAVGEWQSPISSAPAWRPVFLGATKEVMQGYNSSGDEVFAYANLYLVQTQGNELIYFKNSVAGQLPVREFGRQLINSESLESVRSMVVDENGRDRLIWYWYEIGGSPEVSELRAKIRQALAVISGNPAAGVFAVSTLCDETCQSAEHVLMDFLSSWPERPRVFYVAPSK